MARRPAVGQTGRLYEGVFRLVLLRLDPERAHAGACLVLRCATGLPAVRRLVRRALEVRDPALRIEALGLGFPSPLGLAAGFDKDGTSYRGVAALGFGFVEVGTVTALPQQGNARPRIHRLPGQRALVNSMGFPNSGAHALAKRLGRPEPGLVVGVNVGRTKIVDEGGTIADYEQSVRILAPVADYVVINVSSPNTPGLRELQTTAWLRELVTHARASAGEGRRPPILIKIAPDLDDAEIDLIGDLASELGIDGIVAVNTTVDRGCLSGRDETAVPETGGISGPPLQRRALEVLRRLHARVPPQVCLISAGGIDSAEEALLRIRAGASLVQAYTGFVYGGPLWPHRVNRRLCELVRESGAACIQELVGSDSHIDRPAPPVVRQDEGDENAAVVLAS